MKAIIKKERSPGIWMSDVSEPKIGPNDVLIMLRKTAICGTDVHIYKWDEWAQRTIPVPMTIGHEFMGEVVELGAAVNGFQIGDRMSCTSCNHQTGYTHRKTYPAENCSARSLN